MKSREKHSYLLCGAAVLAAVLIVTPSREAPAQGESVLDFSKPAHFKIALPGRSKAKPAVEVENTHLEWHVAKRKGSVFLDVHHVPKDLRSSRALAFRYKSAATIPTGTIRVRIYDTKGGYIGVDLPKATSAWRSIRIPLAYLEVGSPFDATSVRFLELVAWDAPAFVLSLDDIAWLPGAHGVESWQRGRERVADLTEAEAEFAVTVGNSRTAWSAETGLAWHVDAGQEWAAIELRSLTADVRGFEAVELQVRAHRPTAADELRVRFYSTPKDYMGVTLPPLEKPGTWETIRLRLPSFSPSPRFDPSATQWLEVIGWDLASLQLDVRRAEMIAGKRGEMSWRPSEKELKKRIFGARYRRAKRVRTRHFEIHTDSRAARGKFAKILDRHVKVVREHLRLPSVKDRIPVYVFRNAEGYYQYCERALGMSPEQARATAGLGSGECFIVYYREPNDPVVVHELTHTLVHRALGPYGGSWLQEGLAVYVECAFQKKNAANEFATNLRNGRFTPLKKFIATATLAYTASIRESGVAGRNYQQAGAFLAFLKDGPWKQRYPAMLKAFTTQRRDANEQIALLEKHYEKSLDAIEEAWRKWGSERR